MYKLVLALAAVFVLGAVTAVAWAAPPTSKNFNAHLTGSQEVPARDTQAQGQATFKVGGGGSELSYQLSVANIENVVAAHIHCGAAGVNGPVGVFLYGNVPPGGGRVSGVIAKGAISDDDLTAACWDSVEELVDEMIAGNTYVNVHTNDGVAPTNTGPGDFPGGEIRGQIRENGPS